MSADQSADAGHLPVRFECAVAVTDKALEIRMTLTNQGAVDLALFNRNYQFTPERKISFPRDLAFVELEKDVLLVRKMALPVPETLSLAAYTPPFVSPLPAGQSFSETVTLPLPVKVWQPFKEALLDGQVSASRHAHARSIVVEVGVFPVDGPVKLLAGYPGVPDVLMADPAGIAVARQQILSKSFQLKEDLPVLDYRTSPWPW